MENNMTFLEECAQRIKGSYGEDKTADWLSQDHSLALLVTKGMSDDDKLDLIQLLSDKIEDLKHEMFLLEDELEQDLFGEMRGWCPLCGGFHHGHGCYCDPIYDE